MENYMKLDNLSVGYNGKPLIRDICLDVKKGDIITLIGPNGAGKSTILKSITRQLALIGGNVMIESENLRDMSYRDLASKMAVVLTDRIRPELMTCHDIVATGRYPYTGRLGILRPEDEEKVDKALARVQAQEIGSRDFGAISDGQKQRILLARAICQEPDVMILDEPTSFLDIKHKLELLSILRSMAREDGITVIMSLHEIDLAEKISDKIICVKGETIMRYGKPEDIFEENLIRRLYDIERGFFDPVFGSIELPKASGEPKTFVIAGGGSGIGIYRRLQKEGVPFATGILFENDLDYQLARLLAAQVVSEKAFEPISDETFNRAEALMERCERVLLGDVRIGTQNQRLAALIEKAEAVGKLVLAREG